MKNKIITLTTLLFLLSISIMGQQSEDTFILIKTNKGDIKIKLYNETPQHRDNFIKLVKEGFYEGTLFHRVIKNFMIQGGDPQSKNAAPGQRLGNGGPGYTIPAEFNDNLIHKKGALAAARQGDNVNPQKASSGSQFYIVQGKKYSQAELAMYEKKLNKTFSAKQKEVYTTIGGTPFLDGEYTVFGEVVDGIEVVDEIANVQTQPGDRPVEDVKIIAISIVK